MTIAQPFIALKKRTSKKTDYTFFNNKKPAPTQVKAGKKKENPINLFFRQQKKCGYSSIGGISSGGDESVGFFRLASKSA